MKDKKVMKQIFIGNFKIELKVEGNSALIAQLALT